MEGYKTVQRAEALAAKPNELCSVPHGGRGEPTPHKSLLLLPSLKTFVAFMTPPPMIHLPDLCFL